MGGGKGEEDDLIEKQGLSERAGERKKERERERELGR